MERLRLAIFLLIMGIGLLGGVIQEAIDGHINGILVIMNRFLRV
jgi:hypothetical protein